MQPWKSSDLPMPVRFSGCRLFAFTVFELAEPHLRSSECDPKTARRVSSRQAQLVRGNLARILALFGTNTMPGRDPRLPSDRACTKHRLAGQAHLEIFPRKGVRVSVNVERPTGHTAASEMTEPAE